MAAIWAIRMVGSHVKRVAGPDHRVTSRCNCILIRMALVFEDVGLDGHAVVVAGQDTTLAFQRFPHLAVALGRPHTRVRILRGLVVSPGHVEGHAVIEDHPMAV